MLVHAEQRRSLSGRVNRLLRSEQTQTYIRKAEVVMAMQPTTDCWVGVAWMGVSRFTGSELLQTKMLQRI